MQSRKDFWKSIVNQWGLVISKEKEQIICESIDKLVLSQQEKTHDIEDLRECIWGEDEDDEW